MSYHSFSKDGENFSPLAGGIATTSYVFIKNKWSNINVIYKGPQLLSLVKKYLFCKSYSFKSPLHALSTIVILLLF